MLYIVTINMYKQKHGPSVSRTGTRDVDLGRVRHVLMQSMRKVQYVSRFVILPPL